MTERTVGGVGGYVAGADTAGVIAVFPLQLRWPEVCAARLRHALPNAFEVAARSGIRTLGLTVIGTAYRMPGELAVRAQMDAIARAPAELHIVWAFRESALLEVARAAAARVGIVVTANSHSP